MPTEPGTISELMDTSSPEFHKMLEEARTKGEEQLAIQPDTSMESVPETDESKASSATETPSKQESEEEASDDVETLKHQLRGLKAELSRVRGQRENRGQEATELRERIAKLEGRLEAQHEDRNKNTLANLNDDRLLDLEVAYNDELADARAAARLAQANGDTAAIQAESKRIETARQMIKDIRQESNKRSTKRSSSERDAETERHSLNTELEGLYAEVFKAVPDLVNEQSEIWKAGQAEYRKMPTLMKKLGPLGELIATAAAISKNPKLLGKQATQDVLDKIEATANTAFRKGTAPQSGVPIGTVRINSRQDALDFEEKVRRVKSGQG